MDINYRSGLIQIGCCLFSKERVWCSSSLCSKSDEVMFFLEGV